MNNQELYEKLSKDLKVISKKQDSTTALLLDNHNPIKPIEWQGSKSALCSFIYFLRNNHLANSSIKELTRHFTYKGKEIDPESIYNLQNKINNDYDYKINEDLERQLFNSLD